MKNIDNAQFGDILLAEIIFSDNSGSKIRPVVFLYAEGEDYTVLKITSQGMSQYDAVLQITPNIQNQLKWVSFVKMKQISTQYENLFIRNIGSLSELEKQTIRDFLSKMFAEL